MAGFNEEKIAEYMQNGIGNKWGIYWAVWDRKAQSEERENKFWLYGKKYCGEINKKYFRNKSDGNWRKGRYTRSCWFFRNVWCAYDRRITYKTAMGKE